MLSNNLAARFFVLYFRLLISLRTIKNVSCENGYAKAYESIHFYTWNDVADGAFI